MTYGEKAVGLSFNPGGHPEVNQAKELMSEAIDQMHDLRVNSDSQEVKRMCSIAITELQTAQMWMVKAITWED